MFKSLVLAAVSVATAAGVASAQVNVAGSVNASPGVDHYTEPTVTQAMPYAVVRFDPSDRLFGGDRILTMPVVRSSLADTVQNVGQSGKRASYQTYSGEKVYDPWVGFSTVGTVNTLPVFTSYPGAINVPVPLYPYRDGNDRLYYYGETVVCHGCSFAHYYNQTFTDYRDSYTFDNADVNQDFFYPAFFPGAFSSLCVLVDPAVPVVDVWTKADLIHTVLYCSGVFSALTTGGSTSFQFGAPANDFANPTRKIIADPKTLYMTLGDPYDLGSGQASSVITAEYNPSSGSPVGRTFFYPLVTVNNAVISHYGPATTRATTQASDEAPTTRSFNQDDAQSILGGKPRDTDDNGVLTHKDDGDPATRPLFQAALDAVKIAKEGEADGNEGLPSLMPMSFSAVSVSDAAKLSDPDRGAQLAGDSLKRFLASFGFDPSIMARDKLGTSGGVFTETDLSYFVQLYVFNTVSFVLYRWPLPFTIARWFFGTGLVVATLRHLLSNVLMALGAKRPQVAVIPIHMPTI